MSSSHSILSGMDAVLKKQGYKDLIYCLVRSFLNINGDVGEESTKARR